MTTTLEMLTQINEAITAIETGCQEYQYSNRKVVKADLATLYKERERLSQLQAEENNNSSVFGQTVLANFYPR